MSSSYEFEQLKEVLKEEKLKGFLDSIKASSREKNSRIIECVQFVGEGAMDEAQKKIIVILNIKMIKNKMQIKAIIGNNKKNTTGKENAPQNSQTSYKKELNIQVQPSSNNQRSIQDSLIQKLNFDQIKDEEQLKFIKQVILTE